VLTAKPLTAARSPLERRLCFFDVATLISYCRRLVVVAEHLQVADCDPIDKMTRSGSQASGPRHPPSRPSGPRHPPSQADHGPRHSPSSQRTKRTKTPNFVAARTNGPRTETPTSVAARTNGPRHPPSSQRAAGRVNRPRPHSALRCAVL
jgi:hypothetical protein